MMTPDNEWSKEEARLDEDALQYVMADRRGRWFVMRLLDKACINGVTFDRQSALYAAYKEGRRSIGLEYIEALTIDSAHIALKQQGEKEYAEIHERMQERMKGRGLANEYPV